MRATRLNRGIESLPKRSRDRAPATDQLPNAWPY